MIQQYTWLFILLYQKKKKKVLGIKRTIVFPMGLEPTRFVCHADGAVGYCGIDY